MDPKDLTIEILKGIRDEVRGTNERLDQTRTELKAEIATTRRDLGSRIDEVAKRGVEAELRTATALTDLAASVQDVTVLLRTERDLRPRVDRCEQDIGQIKRKLKLG